MLKGARFWQGLAVFCLMSAVGIAANVGVAALMHRDFPEMVYVLPATAGALISVVWNFIAGKAFGFWNRRTRQSAAARGSSGLQGDYAWWTAKAKPPRRHGWATARWASISHLIKYLAIGATASAIDVILFMVIYNLLNAVGAGGALDLRAGLGVFSFVVNARHNFKTSDHMALRLLSFVVVCTIGYLSGFGVIELCRQQGLDSNIGKIISLPVVFAIQYVLNSRITFHKASRAPV